MKTHIFFFAFFMLVMSAYGQIEQFGSKALSGETSEKNNELKSLSKTISSLKLNTNPIELTVVTPADTSEFSKKANEIQEELYKRESVLIKLRSDSALIKSVSKDDNNKILKAKTDSIVRLSKELANYQKQLSSLQEENGNTTKKYLTLFTEIVKSNYVKVYTELKNRKSKVDTAINELSKINVSEIVLASDKDAERNSLADKFSYLKVQLANDRQRLQKQDSILPVIQFLIDNSAGEKQLDSLQKILHSYENVLNSNKELIDEFDQFLKKLKPKDNGSGLFQLGG
ncbi:MAG: hypothetical protein ACT6QS_17420, partial [Flavobacteriales bacterium]